MTLKYSSKVEIWIDEMIVGLLRQIRTIKQSFGSVLMILFILSIVLYSTQQMLLLSSDNTAQSEPPGFTRLAKIIY